MRDGRVLHVLSASGSRGVLPHIAAVSPLALPAAAASVVRLSGANIAGGDNSVLVRSQGAMGFLPSRSCTVMCACALEQCQGASKVPSRQHASVFSSHP